MVKNYTYNYLQLLTLCATLGLRAYVLSEWEDTEGLLTAG